MRSLLSHGLAAFFLTWATTACAAGPLGLLDDHSDRWETSDCDAQCGCDLDACDACSQSPGCCESFQSGCDACCDSTLTRSSICDHDSCCCPRPCSYWSLFGGWNTINDYNGNIAGVPRTGELNDGWAIGIARGRRINCNLRGEMELSYRRFDADSWTIAGVPGNWDGELNGYFGMANLYRDCTNYQFAGFTPYVGGGIGLAIFDGDFNSAAASQSITNEAAFAFQGMAGLTKRISCNIDAFSEYRYLGTTEVQIDRVDVNPDTREGQYATDMHGVMFGIRIWR